MTVDNSAAPDPFVAATGHQGCVCGEGWRFEATDFATGRVKAVLHPITVSWEDNFSAPGSGSMIIATKDYSADDVWPMTTGLYISQVNPDGSRKGFWGGYIEKVSGSAGGATTLGLKSIESYLSRRLLANDVQGLTYDSADSPTSVDPTQAQVAVDLVNLARPKGIPLIPVAGVSGRRQPRMWNYYELKNIGEAIREMVEAVNGVRYHFVHGFSGGFWTTQMVFTDQWGENRNLILKSDREGWQYRLEIDGKDEASRAYGIGEGDGDLQMYSIAFDEDAILPELMASPSWKDTKEAGMLDKQTRGFLTDHRDPVTTPELTIAGMDPDPEMVQPGDTVTVDIGYGLITFQGEAKILSIAWRLEADNPITRTLALQPTIRPSQGIRTQVPAVQPSPAASIPTQILPPSSPWPAEGKLTTVKVGALTEISGMQGSRKTPTAVWVHNDEGENPQVYLIDKATGNKVGSWTPDALLPNDPESIRLNLLTNVLWLADIGDGGGNVMPRRLFAVPEPTSGDKGAIPVTVYDILYAGGGSPNAECFMIHPLTGQMLIATKESGNGKLYSFGNGAAPTPVGSLVAASLPANISDGDITRDGKFALFTTVGQNFVNVYSTTTWQKVGQINIPAMSKCEAISILSPCAFIVTSEGTNPPIYQVRIPTQFGANCTDASSGGDGPIPPGNPVPAQVLNLTNWKLTLPI